MQLQRYKLELERTFGSYFSHDMIDPGFIETELNYSDVIIWIDPIDARKNFLDNPSDVTSIIGLSVKGWPKAGIVHKPFYSEGFGRTFTGTVESGTFVYETCSDTNEMSKATYLCPSNITVDSPFTLVESSDDVCKKYNSPLY